MTIKVQAKGESAAEIMIYDVIGADFFGEGVTAKTVKRDLNALGDVTDIMVRINSPGGNVWDGLAIFNMLKEHSAEVHVQVEGIAASAASLIAMSGDLITMGEGTMMMIHNPYALAMGDGNDMRKAADMLDKVKGEFVDIYSRRTGMKAEAIAELMDTETWLTGAEAVDNGFADERTTESAKVKANSDWDRIVALFKNAPKSLKAGEMQIAAAANPQQSASAGAKPEEATMSANAPASVQADIEMARKEAATAALKADTTRRNEIKSAFGRFADEHKELLASCLDNTECTVAVAREQLLAKLGEGANPVSNGANIVPGADARDKFKAGAEKALLIRAGLEKADSGNEFRGKTLWQIAGIALENAGVNTQGMTPDGLARKVVALTTSDFPNLLSSTAGKILRAEYERQAFTWRRWAAVGSVSDFKIYPRIQMGSFNNLATIPEGGEYTYGGLGEEYENAQAVTKGKALKLTRQMIVNDDLGGFNRRAGMMGWAAARTVNADVYGALTAGSGNNGPTTSDGGQYFNATAITTAGGHANLTSSGTAITADSIGVGELAMRKQKDKNLNDYLDIMPAILLAPAGKRVLAWTLLNATSNPAQTNPGVPNYANAAGLELVTDVYLDGVSATAWYLLADPQTGAAAFEVVFLDGNETPFVDDEVDFDTDALKFKVRLDYGVAIGDWRGAYRNVGA